MSCYCENTHTHTLNYGEFVDNEVANKFIIMGFINHKTQNLFEYWKVAFIILVIGGMFGDCNKSKIPYKRVYKNNSKLKTKRLYIVHTIETCMGSSVMRNSNTLSFTQTS